MKRVHAKGICINSQIVVDIFSRIVKFGIIGVAGFVIDSVCLYVFIYLFNMDFYTGRLASFSIAVTFTWYGNRIFTFRDRRGVGLFREWGRFVLANLPGGFVNYGMYAASVMSFEFARSHPAVAVALGSLAGLIANFTATIRLVYASERQ